MTYRPHITIVAAARPNFMKVGPLIRALQEDAVLRFVHTGQHYDDALSGVFFRQLGLPRPDIDLGVGSGTHTVQTAMTMLAFEEDLHGHATDLVVVVGDVNATLACALVAVQMNVPLAHVEAGLRSHDWSMPEEMNRVVVDRVSDLLFTPSSDADDNLIREGVDTSRIHLVGNLMIDTLLANLERCRAAGTSKLAELAISGDYGVVTLHRPSNVDDPQRIRQIFEALVAVSSLVPLIIALHPRTAAQLDSLSMEFPRTIKVVPSLPYLEFLGVVSEARFVLTDSGGIQEETSVLGVACLTLRSSTERPVTTALGTNTVIGTSVDAIAPAVQVALATPAKPASIPLWDGGAARRTAEIILQSLR